MFSDLFLQGRVVFLQIQIFLTHLSHSELFWIGRKQCGVLQKSLSAHYSRNACLLDTLLSALQTINATICNNRNTAI